MPNDNLQSTIGSPVLRLFAIGLGLALLFAIFGAVAEDTGSDLAAVEVGTNWAVRLLGVTVVVYALLGLLLGWGDGRDRVLPIVVLLGGALLAWGGWGPAVGLGLVGGVLAFRSRAGAADTTEGAGDGPGAAAP